MNERRFGESEPAEIGPLSRKNRDCAEDGGDTKPAPEKRRDGELSPEDLQWFSDCISRALDRR